MARLLTVLAHVIRQPALSAIAATVLALPAFATPTFARGPENIADVAEKVIDAVVNISTSQKVEARGGAAAARRRRRSFRRARRSRSSSRSSSRIAAARVATIRLPIARRAA